MKLDTVLGAFLLSLVVACSSKTEEAPPAPEQPAAATTAPAAPAKDANAPKAETGPATETGATNAKPTTTDPAAPAAPVALTCETAKTVAPAGKLAITTVQGGFGIKPIDVFATEDERGLTISLTETANECGYRAASIAHAQMNELRIRVRKKGDAPIAPGELTPEGIEEEAGTACEPPPEPGDVDFGSNGTALSGGSLRGKVTITTKTATLVEGTVDVKDWQGNKTTFTFTAPICPSAADDAKPAEKEVVCCAGAAPKEDE